MSYLLIDLEKSIAPLHEISLMAGSVFLFAKRKRHLRLAKACANHYRAVKVVKVKSDEKMSDKIEACMKSILKHERHAGIVVMSRRKKVGRIINRLLNRYPKAEVMLLDETWQLNPLPEARETQESTVHVHAALQPQTPLKQLAKPADVPLLSPPKDTQPETWSPSSSDMQNALNILKKNRPRKKNGLLALLEHHLHLNRTQATMVLDQLSQMGVVQHIDYAENVKYSEA